MRESCRLVNATRDLSLAENARIATGIWQRVRGLIGSKRLEPGAGLLIRPCRRIHTFLMAYPIDVLFIDGSSRVTRLYDSLAPCRMTDRVSESRFVIELPAGTIRQTGTQAGDLVAVQSALSVA